MCSTSGSCAVLFERENRRFTCATAVCRSKPSVTCNCCLQVTEPIRFLMDLPQLNVVMMGKQEPNSSWMPQSTIFLVDLAVQLKLRDPSKDVLRLSALGLGLPLT